MQTFLACQSQGEANPCFELKYTKPKAMYLELQIDPRLWKENPKGLLICGCVFKKKIKPKMLSDLEKSQIASEP